MKVEVRIAKTGDVGWVEDILREAAAWLESAGMPMWRQDELSAARITSDVADGRYVLASCDGEVAGTLRFDLEDELFWPDRPPGEAAYLHRLAVRRRHAGGSVSTALMHWAAARARELGRVRLRLDCEADRPALRRFYEDFGFRLHSHRQVGPYYVARYEYALEPL